MPEIRDPVHSFISFDSLERALIDSSPVQRLKYIHQLALSYLVYPGATHTRFEHALGTMELAGRAFDAICQNSPDLARQVFGQDDGERGRWKATLRAAGLLHDVGHAPFSHASDDLLGAGRRHEDLTREFILSDPIRRILGTVGSYRLDPEEVAYVASGIGTPKGQAALLAKEVITGDLGVDRMDYLRRDSLMCGVNYGFYDLPRLVGTLMLARIEGGQPTLALELGGLNAAEGLLTARFFMFSQVYFHRVRDVYDGHVIRFLRSELPNGEYPSSLGQYLKWDDPRVLVRMRNRRQNADARAILEREHYRMVHEFSPKELSSDLGLPDRVEARMQAEFGARVLVRNSQKSAVVLQEGDMLVVDPFSGQVEDILDRSTTLSTFKGVWYLRVFGDSSIRTDVRTMVDELLKARDEQAGEGHE